MLPTKKSPFHKQTRNKNMRISSNLLLSRSLPWEEVSNQVPTPNFLCYLLRCHKQRLLPRHIQQQYWAKLTDLTYPLEDPQDHPDHWGVLEEQVKAIHLEATPLLEKVDLEEGEIQKEVLPAEEVEEGEIPQDIPSKIPTMSNSLERNLLSSPEITPNPSNLQENGVSMQDLTSSTI